jgi:hypothetical protein
VTAQEIRERVEFWTTRLASLGIGHWDFEIIVYDGDIEDAPNCDATADTSDRYDSAALNFRADKVDLNTRTLDEIDQLILHELLHVAMRDFDETIEPARWNMSPPSGTLWANSVEREREGLVERLARTIWSLHYE